MKTTDYQRGIKRETLNARQPEPKTGNGQGQSLGGEIIRPRDRATHGNA